MSAIAVKQEILDLLDNVEDAGICPGDKWVASPWFRLCWPGYSREGAWGQRPSGHHPLIKTVVLPAISAFLGPMQILFSQLLGGFRINPVAKEWDHVPHHLVGLDQHRTRCDSKVMVIGSDEFTNLTLGNLMTVCLCINFESLGHLFILSHIITYPILGITLW